MACPDPVRDTSSWLPTSLVLIYHELFSELVVHTTLAAATLCLIASLFVSKEPLTILNKMETYLNEPGTAKALS